MSLIQEALKRQQEDQGAGSQEEEQPVAQPAEAAPQVKQQGEIAPPEQPRTLPLKPTAAPEPPEEPAGQEPQTSDKKPDQEPSEPKTESASRAWLSLLSVLLILLFMSSSEEFKQEKIEHIMFPLALVSCFVDVISYIRLFAVGMASLSVAQSFNDMAMRLDFSKVWTIPFIALILAAGHGLNILLCVLGILVHGVRLNTLEFSTHKEQEWSGRKYNPFKRSETTNT